MDCCLEVFRTRCQAIFKFAVDGMWFTADAYKPSTMHPRNCRFNAYLSFPSPALVYCCDITCTFMDFMNLNVYICSTCRLIVGYFEDIFVLTNYSQEYWLLPDYSPCAEVWEKRHYRRTKYHPTVPGNGGFPQPNGSLCLPACSLKQNTSPRNADTFCHVSRDEWKAVQLFISFSPWCFNFW